MKKERMRGKGEREAEREGDEKQKRKGGKREKRVSDDYSHG